MMRYRQKTKRIPRKTVFITLAVLIVFACFILAKALHLWPFSNTQAYTNAGQPTQSVDYNPPTPEQTKAGETAKQQTESGTLGSDPTPPPPPPASNSSKSQVGMEATVANVENGILYLRTLIQTVSSTGTCTLTATGPNNKTYKATVSVQAGPSTSTCQGFNIPLIMLSPGTWEFQITFENETQKTSTSTEKNL